MYTIAIIEDQEADRAQIQAYVDRYSQEQNRQFRICQFAEPMAFLAHYTGDYDLVLLDIQLPPFNGMEIARRLRAIDPTVALVFITNMEQFAVEGYQVDALDFVVKPINYYRFKAMMGKALGVIAQNREKEVVVRSASRILRLPISQIYYVQVQDHLLVYHTAQGPLEAWGKLTQVEKELEPWHFYRCSSAYLVNLRHVQQVLGDTVEVAGERLPISQRRRRAFYQRVTDYLTNR